jgi:hypothetical protein
VVDVVSRSEWGARPWSGPVYGVQPEIRSEVLIHYHGNPPLHPVGPPMAREVDAIHHANGWSGVGYNFLVDQEGTAFEGRGWDLVGAHCPNHNRTGFGIYVAVGGIQEPTDAALATTRALYDEACRYAGRPLRKTWHGANYATACPGARLIAWVRAGMQAPTHPDEPTETEMPSDLTPAAVRAVADVITGDKPADQGGAYYRVHDVDEHGQAVLLVPTVAQSEQLRLLRSIDAKLDRLLLKGGQ